MVNQRVSILGFTLLLIFGFISCKKGQDDPLVSFSSRKGRLAGKWKVSAFNLETKTTTEFDYDPDNGINNELIKTINTETETVEENSFSSSSVREFFYEDFSLNATSETTQSGNVYFIRSFNHLGALEDSTGGTYESSHSTTFEINRDGTFSRTVSETSSRTFADEVIQFRYDFIESTEEETTFTGTWAFIGKSDDYGNKERVGFWFRDKQGYSLSRVENVYEDKDPTDQNDYDNWTTSEEDRINYNDQEILMQPDMIWDLTKLSNGEIVINMTESRALEYSITTTETKFEQGNQVEDVSETPYSGVVEINGTMTLVKNK